MHLLSFQTGGFMQVEYIRCCKSHQGKDLLMKWWVFVPS